LLARARTPRRAETFAQHEELLVGYARSLGFGQFARALAYWCYRADPDGTEAEADDDYKARRFHLSEGFAGTRLAEGVFDPIGGAILEDQLRRIEQQLFDADLAEAKARVGPGVCAADLWRTPAQRRADDVVELA